MVPEADDGSTTPTLVSLSSLKSLFSKLTQAANQAFFNDVIASDAFEKTLRLVISFGHVKRLQFVSALEERLAPALK